MLNKNVAKCFSICVFFMVLFSGFSVISGISTVGSSDSNVLSVSSVVDDEICVSYSFDKPSIKSVDLGGSVYSRVELDGCSNMGDPGMPLFPVKPVNILIPEGCSVEDVSVVPSSDRVDLGSGFVVEPGQDFYAILDDGVSDMDGLIPDSGLDDGVSDPDSSDFDITGDDVLPAVGQDGGVLAGDDFDYREGFDPSLLDFVSPDSSVYGSSSVYPMDLSETREVVDFKIDSKRGYNILSANIYPVGYNPGDGSLFYYPVLEVSVTVSENKNSENTGDGVLYRDGMDSGDISVFVDNPETVLTYGSSGSGSNTNDDGSGVLGSLGISSGSLDDSGGDEVYDYVIITSEELKNYDGINSFQDLIESKELQGFSCMVKTVEDIKNEYSGVDVPEMIRNFIRFAYSNWGTEYVLLGGDMDIVPARKLYASVAGTSYFDNIPSDVYYSCLDGSFNFDGDSYWGEPIDGPNGGDVDLMSEVYVGRAPVGNVDELCNFVKKTLGYENADGIYLNRALMVGEYLGFVGDANYGSEMKNQVVDECYAHGYHTFGIPSLDYAHDDAICDPFVVDTLYDKEYEERFGESWKSDTLIDRLNSGVHLVNHLGHANYGYAMKLFNKDILGLNNTNPFFLYSQGCNAGGFDKNDSAAEYFTVKSEFGAFAAVMNARFGFGRYGSTDGPSQRYDREFFDAIFGEGKNRLGPANQDSKEDNIYRIYEQCMRWVFYGLNLFGDPSVRIKNTGPSLRYTPGFADLGSLEAGDVVSTVFDVWNDDSADLGFSVDCDDSFVSINPGIGVSSDGVSCEVEVMVDTRGLSNGSYRAVVDIESNGGSGRFIVVFSVGSVLDISPTEVDLGNLERGDVVDTVFDVCNSGLGVLDFSVVSSYGFIDVSPVSGVSSGLDDVTTVNVVLDTGGLDNGCYSFDVNLSSNGGSGVFSLVFNVGPVLSLSSNGFDFGLVPGGEISYSDSVVFGVGNVGVGSLEFDVSCDAGWVSVTPVVGSVSSGDSVDVEVVVDAGGLGYGRHSCEVSVVSSGGDGVFVVEVDVGLVVFASGSDSLSSSVSDWSTWMQYAPDMKVLNYLELRKYAAHFMPAGSFWSLTSDNQYGRFITSLHNDDFRVKSIDKDDIMRLPYGLFPNNDLGHPGLLRFVPFYDDEDAMSGKIAIVNKFMSINTLKERLDPTHTSYDPFLYLWSVPHVPARLNPFIDLLYVEGTGGVGVFGRNIFAGFGAESFGFDEPGISYKNDSVRRRLPYATEIYYEDLSDYMPVGYYADMGIYKHPLIIDYWEGGVNGGEASPFIPDQPIEGAPYQQVLFNGRLQSYVGLTTDVGFYRGFLDFDLSCVPEDAVVSHASMGIYADGTPPFQFVTGYGIPDRIVTPSGYGISETSTSYNEDGSFIGTQFDDFPEKSLDFPEYLGRHDPELSSSTELTKLCSLSLYTGKLTEDDPSDFYPHDEMRRSDFHYENYGSTGLGDLGFNTLNLGSYNRLFINGFGSEQINHALSNTGSDNKCVQFSLRTKEDTSYEYYSDDFYTIDNLADSGDIDANLGLSADSSSLASEDSGTSTSSTGPIRIDPNERRQIGQYLYRDMLFLGSASSDNPPYLLIKYGFKPDKPSNPNPVDGSVGVGVNPVLSVDVSDPEDDILDVYFYDASDYSLIGVAENVESGSRASVFWYGLDYESSYSWFAVADDDEFVNKSDTWSFTTGENSAPVANFSFTPEDPVVGELVKFDASLSFDDNFIEEYRWGSINLDSYKKESMGYGRVVFYSWDSPGTYLVELIVVDDRGLMDDFIVPVDVVLDEGSDDEDSDDSNNDHDEGDGVNSPPLVSLVNLENNSWDVSVDLSEIRFLIEDLDGDSFSWSVSTVPDIGSNSDNGDVNGTKVCAVSDLDFNTTYSVFVNASDMGSGNTTNCVFVFNTETNGSDDEDDEDDGVDVNVDIVSPVDGGLYLFNKLKFTLFKTVVIGGVDFVINVSGTDVSVVDNVSFFVDDVLLDSFVFNDSLSRHVFSLDGRRFGFCNVRVVLLDFEGKEIACDEKDLFVLIFGVMDDV